jgi:hypothetical protein
LLAHNTLTQIVLKALRPDSTIHLLIAAGSLLWRN